MPAENPHGHERKDRSDVVDAVFRPRVGDLAERFVERLDLLGLDGHDAVRIRRCPFFELIGEMDQAKQLGRVFAQLANP